MKYVLVTGAFGGMGKSVTNALVRRGFGAFLVNKAFIPYLKSGGRILMTTSELATLDSLPFTGIYAVSKAALDKYAYSLDMEVQLLGIKASVIRAGAVNTGMLGASTDALEKFCEKTKLYSNPLLCLLNLLPKRAQLFAIRCVLK